MLDDGQILPMQNQLFGSVIQVQLMFMFKFNPIFEIKCQSLKNFLKKEIKKEQL
jgi:hypothetical protein